MDDFQEDIQRQLTQILDDLNNAMKLNSNHLLVVGASTSEVIGEHIGTSGTVEVADSIYRVFSDFKRKTGVHYAFQCCEHLNRALVVERSIAEKKNYEPVTVVPVRSAGGSMAAYAFNKMDDPVVVEHIKADCGIDIGDTFIGMHMKSVVIPVRSTVHEIGQAHVTMARTRPRLIGGERAVYPEREKVNHF
ncbi:uncharacterized protein (TIGR01440 family) [Scopulibacillus darangshiensis]|uniref:UPF0340 protein EV207_15411 n=1 Tax=Scopulibacillus darangshiensis TaxID=442528 RepID=A0A4R2NFT7_9BACL|nr:TIGR01440 family protein [Scopulibacillus darangshiensis]TCP20249.1 uncharacterized protein (TIGR01440 family) [Scopulibacillus darangshiensis]